MFEHTSNDGTLTVYEAVNGFYLRHNATSETAGIGDGVDLFTDHGGPDDDGGPVAVGTPVFYDCLREWVEDPELGCIYFEECD